MVSEINIREVINSAFRSKSILNGIGDDTDFFDMGASSLTVVDLQLQIEKALGVTAETSELMEFPTINGWVDAYSRRISAS